LKWIEDRNEHLPSSAQAREERMDLEAARHGDGTIIAMRGELNPPTRGLSGVASSVA